MIKLALIVFLVISSVFSCETDPLLSYQNDSQGTQTVTFELPTSEQANYTYKEQRPIIDGVNEITLKFRELDISNCMSCAGICFIGSIFACDLIFAFGTVGASTLLGSAFGPVVGWSVCGASVLINILSCAAMNGIGFGTERFYNSCILGGIIRGSRRLSSITYPKSLDLHDVISFLTTKGYINELDLESATFTK